MEEEGAEGVGGGGGEGEGGGGVEGRGGGDWECGGVGGGVGAALEAEGGGAGGVEEGGGGGEEREVMGGGSVHGIPGVLACCEALEPSAETSSYASRTGLENA